MNGDDMLSALNHIDEKYIAEAEAAKISGGGIWLRVGSVAACLCLIFAGVYGLRQREMQMEKADQVMQTPAGGMQVITPITQPEKNEAKAEQPARGMQDFAISEEADYTGAEPDVYGVLSRNVRADGGMEDAVYPYVTVLRSAEELEDYCLTQGEIYDLESGFKEACEAYDESYFANNDLILLCVEEAGGAMTHQVTGMYQKNGIWIISVVRYVPEEATYDVSQWHILIEVQMGKVIAPESTVTVQVEYRENGYEAFG